LADIFFFCCSCWWPIAGTGRLSLHSFGIAVDLGGPRADYRVWGARANDGRFAWRSRIHWEIVEVFKRHGFIWGASGTTTTRCISSTDRNFFSPLPPIELRKSGFAQSSQRTQRKIRFISI
jgi:hypothetical protein